MEVIHPSPKCKRLSLCTHPSWQGCESIFCKLKSETMPISVLNGLCSISKLKVTFFKCHTLQCIIHNFCWNFSGKNKGVRYMCARKSLVCWAQKCGCVSYMAKHSGSTYRTIPQFYAKNYISSKKFLETVNFNEIKLVPVLNAFHVIILGRSLTKLKHFMRDLLFFHY